MKPIARLPRDRRGIVALEFAIVGPFLIFLLLAIIEVSLLGWTQVVLQLTAAQTARCVGIGSSACADSTQFAVDTATNWLFANSITADNVAVTAGATCGSAPGHYVKVTITSQFLGTSALPGILGGGALSAQSCYFTGA
jgi:Flp pilus assembly protein TadG